MDSLPERDWKHLRVVHRAAVERFCGRVLGACSSIVGDSGRTAHERYLALFRLVEDSESEIAATFNDLRRSTAMQQLLAVRGLELVSDQEWAGFSPETRARVTFIEGHLAGIPPARRTSKVTRRERYPGP